MPAPADSAPPTSRPAVGLLRAAAAIAAGFLLTTTLAYAATVVIVLATVGIPLGARPQPLTAAQAAMLLAAAAAAGALGGRTTARLARPSGRLCGGILAATLAGAMLWGFGGPNDWPDWWGLATGAATATSAWLGARTVAR